MATLIHEMHLIYIVLSVIADQAAFYTEINEVRVYLCVR